MARLFGPEKKDSSESSWLSESENLSSEPAAYLNLQLPCCVSLVKEVLERLGLCLKDISRQ